MHEAEIRGITVKFPFKPYDLQLEYMSKVIECLQNSENGILESPTGTGKTLSLLCSTLAWYEIEKARYKSHLHYASNKDTPESLSFSSSQVNVGQSWGGRAAPPKIIYSSRTHSQLAQAISEFKRTAYFHLKMAILASRDQMCIHPQVSKEADNNSKVHMCQMRVKAKTCFFYNQVEAKKDEPQLCQKALDIEDLVKLGKKSSFCPYYMARELKQDADIIFMPYNYLLDPKSRQAHGIELAGNVVIFDEAHNVQKISEDVASLQIHSTDIALCIDEVTQVMKKIQDISEGSNFAANDSSQAVQEDFSPDDLYTLKALFLEFEKVIDAIHLPSDGSGSTFPGSYMFKLMETIGITVHKKTVILELLDKLIQYMTVNSASPFQRKGAGLQKFSDLIKTVFTKDSLSQEQAEFIMQSYKVHVNVEDTKKKGSGRQEGWGAPRTAPVNPKVERVLSYWCFNPGFGMKDLIDQGVKCIILTSGTLSPLDSFISELEIPLPIQLSNPHIIKPHQVWVGAVCEGPDGVALNSSFKTRYDPRYINSIGQMMVNFARIIPGGMLVFFPSYSMLKLCVETYQKNEIWNNISTKKPIFVEPQTKSEFQCVMEEFGQKINDPTNRGACLMAVCRGKVSEGMDFADHNGRAVIVIGRTYLPCKDPKIILKQQYLDETRLRCKGGISGWNWYHLDASRAVNQAVGRVIRHKDDFGAIILCDNRYASPNIKAQLSDWVRPNIITCNTFSQAIRGITHFFRENQNLLPQPEVKSNAQPAFSFSNGTPETTLQSTGPSPAIQEKKELAEAARIHLENNEWSTKGYTLQIESIEKPKGDGSIFTALQQKSSVVDFNNCSNLPQASSKYDTVRVNKKRKIRIIPEYESENSISSVEKKETQNTLSHNLEPLNNTESSETFGSGMSSKSQENIPCGQDNLVHSRREASVIVGSALKKKYSVAAYIKEVKSTISKEQYADFSSAVKDYQKNRDYGKVVGILASLFVDNPEQHRLFRKFEHFLIKDHRPIFQETCSHILHQ